jgi:hypothetical protein
MGKTTLTNTKIKKFYISASKGKRFTYQKANYKQENIFEYDETF